MPEEIIPLEGRLQIKTREGCKNRNRMVSSDLEITLDGHALPPIASLSLSIEPRDAIRVVLGFYPKEIEVDSAVLGFIKSVSSPEDSEGAEE